MSEEEHQRAPIRIVLADNQKLIHVGLGSILYNEPDMKVVGEAFTGLEAVELCRSKQPDLVLMDVEMPEMDGLEATRLIKKEQPQIGVLFLSAHEKPSYLLEAISAGAGGYLLKEHAFSRVTSAIRRIVDGEAPLDQELALRLLRSISEGKIAEPTTEAAAETLPNEASALLETLTAREQEILSLMAKGCTNGQIAEQLFVGVGTVKTHVHRIISKLGVSDRTQAAIIAIRLGHGS